MDFGTVRKVTRDAVKDAHPDRCGRGNTRPFGAVASADAAVSTRQKHPGKAPRGERSEDCAPRAAPTRYQKGVSPGDNAASGLLWLSLPILLYGDGKCNRQFWKLCSVFVAPAPRLRRQGGESIRARPRGSSPLTCLHGTKNAKTTKRSRICGSSR